MGFSSRNQLSEKDIVNSRMKAASKKNNSFDQKKNDSGVQIPGKDQLVHQKNAKDFASEKMFTKNNQKTEGGSRSGYNSQQTKKAAPKKQVASKEAKLDSPKKQSASQGGDCNKLMKNLRVKEARLDSPKKQAASEADDCNKLRKNLRVKESRFHRLHQKKLAAVYPEPEPEPKGINVEDQLSLFDRLSEDSDCMWLFSDSLPSSFLQSNASQDTWELDCLDQFLQHKLTLLSSSRGNSTSFDEYNESVDLDRSESCPVSETSLILGGQSGCGENDVEELLRPELFGIKGQECSVQNLSSYRTAVPEGYRS